MRAHPLYLDPRRRAELHETLDSAFPGLVRRIDAAQALGFDWDLVTTPFVDYRDDCIVSHVGVLDVPIYLDGRAVRMAGVHAVCTRPGVRRQGHYRRAMEQALHFIDQRWECAQLTTDDPPFYEPFGFRVVPVVRFEAVRRATLSGVSIPIGPHDLPKLVQRLVRRTPISHVYAAMDDGWLFGIDTILKVGNIDCIRFIPELDLFIAGQLDGERYTLYDVITDDLPDWDTLGPRLPGTGSVELAFTPDRFPDASTHVLGPDKDGYYMVRGPFPLEGRDFALPPFAQH